MQTANWTLANLDRQQLDLLKRDEPTLHDGVLLAFSQSGTGPSAQRYDQLPISHLDSSQVECLQGLEQKLGVVLIAVQPK